MSTHAHEVKLKEQICSWRLVHHFPGRIETIRVRKWRQLAEHCLDGGWREEKRLRNIAC